MSGVVGNKADDSGGGMRITVTRFVSSRDAPPVGSLWEAPSGYIYMYKGRDANDVHKLVNLYSQEPLTRLDMNNFIRLRTVTFTDVDAEDT